MSVINLRSVDDALVEEISRLAEANRHSLEQEAVSLIRDGLRTQVRRELVDKLDRIAAMTPKGVKQTDSVDLIREDRDR